ncbi:MAG: polysaccharide deacetylase family protein [Herbinix sp.]|nr:polysaccharide deacetylase family protein [Herbinix sp.]
MKLFLTIDLEDWYNAHDYAIPKESWDECQSRVEKNTIELLNLLSKYDVKAVFFVLGYIAKRHPELVKDISERGHEIASHGYWHDKLYDLNKDELKSDLKMSLQHLEGITDKKVRYYRAPSWTYDKRSEYLHDILKGEGILVDSSVQPFWTPLSGITGASFEPYYPVINEKKSRVLEFPVPVYKIGPLKIPFCGGFYFRLMPYWFIDFCLKDTLKRRDCFVYIHPWEIDSEQPKPRVSLLMKFIHNYGIKGNKRKLERLLKNYKFSDPKKFGIGELTDDEYKLTE